MATRRPSEQPRRLLTRPKWFKLLFEQRSFGGQTLRGVAAVSSGGKPMLKKAFFAATALVVGVSPAFAQQGPTTQQGANAQFVSWYGGSQAAGAKYHHAPRDGSSLLYEQSASSGFSTYGVS